MKEYQCQTCRVITTIDDNESWYSILKKHREAHLGTKWGPSYEFCRFAYYTPRCVRVNCNEPGTRTVRSEYFGASFCDKHWKEEQSPKRKGLIGSLLRV